jgi:4-diphosphocytidyl-2-C-methyl-D-erythritol kinase
VDTRAFTLPSFAKINWTLRVLGKRPDGYHEIRTQLQTISLQDELSFASRADNQINLTSDSSDIPSDQTNLVIRAANSLRSHCGITAGADLILKKRIPIKAGLGGGSSNAAVALMGLARLWKLKLESEDLAGIGATLGADVHFFFFGGRALGTGRGSDILPLPDSDGGPSNQASKYLLVITPNATVSTVEAYAALGSTALTSVEAESILAVSRENTNFCDSDQGVEDELENDFQQVIFDREPEIERARNALLQAGARGALLAGSGSSVFGIFDDVDAQSSAAAKVEAEAGWRIFSCVTISRSEYARALR